MQTDTTPAGQRPGRMTTVMSAVPPAAGPRVLRVGVAQGGRILEERTMAPREAVTVGPSERSTFVVVAAGLPASHRLLERVGDDQVLNVREGMGGRVALADGVVDLERLPRPCQVRLSGDARGRVVIGETTLLFQLEAPRPVPSRPRLPAGVLGGVGDEIDWTMTIIAAFSFLIHFGAAGSMYSNWADRIVADEATLHGAALVVLTSPPRPPPTETPRESEAITPSTPSDRDSPAPLDRTAHKVRAPSDRGPSDGHRAPSPANAALGEQIARLEVEMMRALGGTGPAAASVLDSRPIAGSLDGFARQDQGAGPSSASGLRLTTGDGGPVGPGERPTLGDAIPGTSTRQGSGTAQLAAGPGATDRRPEAPRTTGKISNADRVIALARARARACYQQGLGADPDLEGRASFTITVSAGGSVSSAVVTPAGGLTPAVAGCIKGVLTGLTFEAPEGGVATVTGSFSFVNANRKK